MIQKILFNHPSTLYNIKPTKNNIFDPKNKYMTSICCDQVIFKGQVNYVSFNELMRKTLGFPSKEDSQAIASQAKKLVKKYHFSDIKDLIEDNKKSVDEIAALVEGYGIKVEKTEQGLKFAEDISALDKAARGKIKKIHLNALIKRESFFNINPKDPLLKNPSYGDWFRATKYNSKIPNSFNSLYTHPVEKAKFLVGDLLGYEQENINKKINSNVQKKISIKKLEQNIEITLKKIKSVIDSSSFVKDGVLTKKALKTLRQNVIQYEINDRSLGKNKLFSKEIESIIINSNKKLSMAKVGDIIDDLGLVIQKTSVYDRDKRKDIPCLILFNKELRDHSLKLIKIDNEHENIVYEFKKEYENIKNSFDFNNQEKNQMLIDELDKKAKTILKSEKEMNVSGVHFSVVPVENLKSFLMDMNQPKKVDNLVNNLMTEATSVNKIAIVASFINSDSKRYYEGGRKVVLPLIHLLKENNCNNIFMRASAIGENKKAPVPLYLRAGFKPISHTEEEIAKAMDNHMFWNPKIPVYMYLPENALVNDVVAEQKPLHEIFTLNQV